MDLKVTKEVDGVWKLGDYSYYFVLPRHDFPAIAVAPIADQFVIYNYVFDRESFHRSKDEAETMAEEIITTARYAWVEVALSTLSSDNSSQEAFVADCKWVAEAARRQIKRRKKR